MFRPTRRLVIAGAAALSLGPRIAFARPEDVAYAIRQDFGPFTAVDSPMTAEGYPEGIRLYGSGNPRPHIVTLRFTPLCGRAVFSTRIRLNGAQDVTAIARTSRGEYLRATQPVGVSFGACATAGDSSGLPENWKPSVRVSVPETAPRGLQIDVRTIITHPMETGLRLNPGNQYVPLRIIERFLCYVNDVLALDIRLAPAISTNPYLAFQLCADTSDEVRMEWQDTTGAVYRESAALVAT